MTQPKLLVHRVGILNLDLERIDPESMGSSLRKLLDKFSEEYYRSQHANHLAFLQAEGFMPDDQWVRTTRQNLKFYLERRIREAAS